MVEVAAQNYELFAIPTPKNSQYFHIYQRSVPVFTPVSGAPETSRQKSPPGKK